LLLLVVVGVVEIVVAAAVLVDIEPMREHLAAVQHQNQHLLLHLGPHTRLPLVLEEVVQHQALQVRVEQDQIQFSQQLRQAAVAVVVAKLHLVILAVLEAVVAQTAPQQDLELQIKDMVVVQEIARNLAQFFVVVAVVVGQGQLA